MMRLPFAAHVRRRLGRHPVCQRPQLLVLEDRLPLGDTVGGVLAWSLLGPSALTPPSGPGPSTGIPALAARRDGLSDFGVNSVPPLEAARVALLDVVPAAKGSPGQGAHDAPGGHASAPRTRAAPA